MKNTIRTKGFRVVGNVCPSCMEHHPMKIVEFNEKIIFHRKRVTYPVEYFICENTGELFANQTQLDKNELSKQKACEAKFS